MAARVWYSYMALALALFAATQSKASDNPSFTAVCQDVVTHGYRDSTDIAGEPMGDSWSENEQFNSRWTFSYDGDRRVTIDGDPGHVLAAHPGVLIISDAPFSNGYGAGIWVYALHIGMKKIVASQVHAHGGFEPEDRGVKARSTELKCSFELE